MIQETDIQEINITKSKYRTFTTFKFYTEFLPDLKRFYSSSKISEPPAFSLRESSYIDPSTLPLIISLGNSLKQYHHKEIPLRLSNIPGTLSNKVINFLDKSDFFNLVGDNTNPSYAIGRRIFNYEKGYVGWNISNLEVRDEHKIRGYSLKDLRMVNLRRLTEDLQRDKLIEHYIYAVDDDFNEVYEYNGFTDDERHYFNECLSELISNSLIHSDSDCFVSFHSNRFKTAISISDTGIGFYKSLYSKKHGEHNYRFLELSNSFKKITALKLTEDVKNNFFSIFEALYYSCLKNRRGLFDLICSIVLKGHGIFRIHNFSSQLIISSKLESELNQIYSFREEIFEYYLRLKRNNDEKDLIEKNLSALSTKTKEAFFSLASKVINNYTNNVQYSPVRFFNIEFKGVHIEAEIPRTYLTEEEVEI